ncbi:MAG: aminoacyl-tRNA deacylase [Gaiellaceae bacterium]
MATKDLTGILDEAGVDYEVLAHAHTERAADEAEALGLSPGEVAKTLVVTTPAGNVRAVLPASERIDLRKLGELDGESRKHLHLATEEALKRDYPEFELGAVPPLGGAHGDRVVVDRRLADRDSVVLEAGSHDESIRVQTADLIRLAGARVADICADA